jgi:hypothetical protein
VVVAGGEVEVVGAAEVAGGGGDDGVALGGAELRVAQDGDALIKAAALPGGPRGALHGLHGLEDAQLLAAALDEADVGVGAGGGPDDRAGLGGARGVEDEVAVEEGGGVDDGGDARGELDGEEGGAEREQHPVSLAGA